MNCKCLKFSWILICFIFFGCSIWAETSAPYQISGKMVLEDSSNYENAGFEFSFYNRSEKEVKDFTVVFYLFDEDGNIPLNAKNNLLFKIENSVEACSSVDLCLSLDKYLSYIPEEPYLVEFLYVSSITYVDGSVWNDPLGFFAA